MEKKHQIIGKNLIEAGQIVVLKDLFKYIPQIAVAAGMGIHHNTLPKRMDSLGDLTLENLVKLGEEFQIDPMIIVAMGAKEYIEQRKKKRKPKK